MRIRDSSDLAQHCRESRFGFEDFRQQSMVVDLGWPADVVEQWVYDHTDKVRFLQDYENVELSQIEWQVEALAVDAFMAMPTGPSDGDTIEEFAANPDLGPRCSTKASIGALGVLGRLTVLGSVGRSS